MSSRLSEKQLRVCLERATERMEEIRAKFKNGCSDEGRYGAWARGVAEGVEMSLHALFSFTDGEFGVDHRETERNEAAALDSAVTS